MAATARARGERVPRRCPCVWQARAGHVEIIVLVIIVRSHFKIVSFFFPSRKSRTAAAHGGCARKGERPAPLAAAGSASLLEDSTVRVGFRKSFAEPPASFRGDLQSSSVHWDIIGTDQVPCSSIYLPVEGAFTKFASVCMCVYVCVCVYVCT